MTYYLPVCYLLRILQYPVNTTYNKAVMLTQAVTLAQSKEHTLWSLAISFAQAVLLAQNI